MSATTISPETIATGVYAIDPSHSNVSFEVRHMGIATVRGSFKKFAGQIDATGDAPVLEGAVEVASIDTGDENRDGHLQAPDFFDVAQYPQISFHSTGTEPAGDGADPSARRDHDQGDHEADRADRHDRRERPGPVGQRARWPRGRGQDRPPRVRPEVESDASERQPAGRQ